MKLITTLLGELTGWVEELSSIDPGDPPLVGRKYLATTCAIGHPPARIRSLLAWAGRGAKTREGGFLGRFRGQGNSF